MRTGFTFGLLAILAVAGCGDDPIPDAGFDSGGPDPSDAGRMDAGGDDAGGTDAGGVDAGVDGGAPQPPALFAISNAGGAPVGWLDLATLTSDRAPDLMLWGLDGAEGQSMDAREGRLVLATDELTAPVMIWNDPRSAADGAMPDVTIPETPFGGRVTSRHTFVTDAGDIWLVDNTAIWRLIDGVNGGTTAVSFAILDVSPATTLDPVGDTLFASPDGSSIVAYEGATMATGTGNPVTWTFDTTTQPTDMVVGADRLFVASRDGNGGDPVMRIWNGISSLAGPTAPPVDESLVDATRFARYVSLFVTVDDFLVAVFEPGIPGGAGGGAPPREIHVFAGASTMTAATTPTVISDASFAGLDNIVVSNAGTLYGPADAGIVVVPTVTGTAGTPFTLSFSADLVRVVE